MVAALAQIDWNSLLKHNDFQVIMVFAMAALIAITAIIAIQWRKVQEVRLKEKMVDRGFTAEEIGRVMNVRGAAVRDVRAIVAKCEES